MQLLTVDNDGRLQNKVIDIEVSNSTPSPTIDPSVHTILIGHSMGGIVAAETLLLLASEEPLPHPTSPSTSTTSASALNGSGTGSRSPHFMFPHILSLLTFDTPFLGISPTVIAYGAESHYRTASSAYNTFTQLSGLFSSEGSKSESALPSQNTKPTLALPAPSVNNGDAAATPQWQRWGRYAMFAGAAGAVAAAGAGVYSQRAKIGQGLGWVGGHLEFVGCLARGEELKRRVERVSKVVEERGASVTQFYTVLGKGADGSAGKASEGLVGRERTFCNLPRSKASSISTMSRSETSSPTYNLNPSSDEDKAANSAADAKESVKFEWRKAVNEKARDETSAHMSMFFPRDNPGFFELVQESAIVVGASVVGSGWYESATPAKSAETSSGGGAAGKRTRDGSAMRGDGAVEEEFEDVRSGDVDVDMDGEVVDVDEGDEEKIDIIGYGDARAKGTAADPITIEEDVEDGDAVMVSSITNAGIAK
jgi:pimeloyl-ACP methyl ester carboxylesterase